MHRKRSRILATLAIAAALLLGLIKGPGLALRAVGMKPQGTIQTTLAAIPTTAPEASTGRSLDTIEIACLRCRSGEYSVQELGMIQATGRLDVDGQPVYRLVFDEAGFNHLYSTWLFPALRETPFRGIWLDLRDGGMVAYANTNVDPDGYYHFSPDVTYMGIHHQGTDQAIEVLDVLPLGPADRAGLKVGDVIHKLDGDSTADVPSLPDWTRAHAPGDVVALTVVREGQEIVVEIELGIWEQDSRWHDLGLVLAPDATGARLVHKGLSVGKDVYSLPQTGSLATAIVEAQHLLDDLLEQFVVVGPLKGETHIDSIHFTEDGLVVVMR